MLEFRVLGSLEVVRDGATIDVPSRLQRALITRLLLSWGRVVPAADLVDALWEDAPPGRPRHALHVLVSRARALLGTALVTRAQGYALEVSKDAVDAERFEAAVRQAGSMAERDPARAVDVLDDALGLWRGTPYGEFADTFAQADVVRLEELRLVAQETLGEALLAIGALDRAVSGLSALVADHPLQERPHCLLMRALYLPAGSPRRSRRTTGSASGYATNSVWIPRPCSSRSTRRCCGRPSNRPARDKCSPPPRPRPSVPLPRRPPPR